MFAEPWDARFIYAAQSWALNAVWDLIGTGPSADILAPCGYSWLGYPHAQSYFRVIADLLPKFRAVVYHSTEYQDYQFARDRGLHENATVIPNGTTPVKDSGLLDKHDEGRPCVLLTVGSHVRSKGHADFFRVRRQVAHPAALVAPRPATLRERMRGCYYLCRARHSADSGVELIEGSRRETVDAAYRQAGIFFLPSTIETAPLVILEAMASGTPWVSYEVGSVKTLPGGIVVADAADAAREIRSMAADPDRRRRLARAGRNAVEATYSWDRVLPQYEAVVEASARL
jgi:glycosyltransferase involved in cell wall biosynthesis